MRFHITKHFYQRLEDRDLSSEDCKEIVRNADSCKVMAGTGPNGGKRKAFKKSRGGKTLVVVAEIKQNEVWLITAYHES